LLKVSQLWPILIKNVSHRQINFEKKSPLEDNSMNIFPTVNFQPDYLRQTSMNRTMLGSA
jgi:hypothetical protein